MSSPAGTTPGQDAASAASGDPNSPPPHAFRPPTLEEMQMQEVMNMCPVRAALSGVMGGATGVFMGMLFGALEQPLHPEEMTTRQILVQGVKTMGSKSLQMGKAFAFMGAVFAGAECVVEKARAKHDMTNTLIAGCVTGAALSARAGPQAACLGCAGFASFSAAIEHFLTSRE